MTKENKNIFGKNLSYYMLENDITRNTLCKDLGFKYMTVSDWINGKTYPRIDKIEALANYFGIQKSDLIEDKRHNKSLSKKETNILDNYRNSNDLGKEKIHTYSKDIVALYPALDFYSLSLEEKKSYISSLDIRYRAYGGTKSISGMDESEIDTLYQLLQVSGEIDGNR